MSMTVIQGEQGEIPVYVSIPETEGRWPGVVVHDALGMTKDLQNQTRWLAKAGYLVAAPDLFHWGGRLSCLFKTMRDLMKGDKGRAFDDLSAVRNWLIKHPGCTGEIGIVGFCYGGGYALALAPEHGYAAAAVNYGAVTDWGWSHLQNSCPIVGSFGEKDSTLKREPERIKAELIKHNVPHDIKIYEGVGHGFMNHHDARDSNWIFNFLSWASNTSYNEKATLDAQKRIISFFNTHLRRTEAI